MPNNEPILTLIGNIKDHLSKIQADPLSQIYSEIPEELLKANVNDIKAIADLRFQGDSNPTRLTLTCSSTSTSAWLSKKTLGVFGLSIESFLNDIKVIQDTNSDNTLKKAIKKTIHATHERDLKNHPDQQEVLKEALKASHKRYLENKFFPIILHYTQLYEKVRLLNPTYSKEKVFEHIDDLLKKDSSRELTLISDQFSRAYQGKQGFSTIFRSEEDRMPYTITQKLIENSDSDLTAYLNIIHTIERLPIYLQHKPAAEQLVGELKHFSDSYFSNLLKINSSESLVETKIKARMEAFDKFKKESHACIKGYEKEHPKESTPARIFLNKLMWLITKLIPVINKERRMMMFGGPKKASSRLLKNIALETTRIIKRPYDEQPECIQHKRPRKS